MVALSAEGFLVWRLSSWAALILAGILLFFFLSNKRHRFLFKFFLGALFSVVVNWSLKFIFSVPRTVGFGPAFPSFHAQMIFFVAILASLEDRRLAWLLIPSAFLISVSRVTQGFHSVVDVAAGAFIGLALAFWFYRVKLKKVHVKEMARQLIHFSGLFLVPIVMLFSYFDLSVWFLSPSQSVGGLCLLFAAVALLAPRTGAKKIAGLFQRTKEKGYEGALLFFVATGFVLLAFPEGIALAGLISLSVGDSVSTIYGLHLGRFKLLGNKTLVGSMACFFFAHSVLVVLLGPKIALPAAMAATIIELFPGFNDNFSIPLGVCGVLSLLSWVGYPLGLV